MSSSEKVLLGFVSTLDPKRQKVALKKLAKETTDKAFASYLSRLSDDIGNGASSPSTKQSRQNRDPQKAFDEGHQYAIVEEDVEVTDLAYFKRPIPREPYSYILTDSEANRTYPNQ